MSSLSTDVISSAVQAQLCQCSLVSKPTVATHEDGKTVDSPFGAYNVSDLVTLLALLDVRFIRANQVFMGGSPIILGTGGHAAVKYEELDKHPGDPSNRVAVAIKQYSAIPDCLTDETRFETVGSSVITQAYIEICIMKHPRLATHSHLLQLLGITDELLSRNSPSVQLCLITEYAELGSLETYLDRHPSEIDWALKSQIMCDIADGLHAMHSCDIVHNDVKASNVLLFASSQPTRNITAKMSDFGCSVPLAATKLMRRAAGTKIFAPLEAYPHDSLVRLSRDVFSFGVLGLHLAMERAPFIHMKEEQVMEVKESTLRLHTYIQDCLQTPSTPPFFINLLQCTLQASQQERIATINRASVLAILAMGYVPCLGNFLILYSMPNSQSTVHENLDANQDLLDREWLLEIISPNKESPTSLSMIYKVTIQQTIR